MIKSFRSEETKQLFEDQRAPRFEAFARIAKRKLYILDAAKGLQDMVSSGNRLEKLRGNREGQYSIRVNDQWRICFVWRNGDAYEVEIADYH